MSRNIATLIAYGLASDAFGFLELYNHFITNIKTGDIHESTMIMPLTKVYHQPQYDQRKNYLSYKARNKLR